MSKGPSPLLFLGLGAGVWLAFSESGQRFLSGLMSGGKPSGQAGGEGSVGGPTFMDPLSAAIGTVGGLVQSILPDLQDRDSDARQGLRQLDRNVRELGSKIGITSSPKKKEAKKRTIAGSIAQELRALETFALNVHQQASRADVLQWVIDTPTVSPYGVAESRPRISIYYARKDPKTGKTVPSEPYVMQPGETWTRRGLGMAFLAEGVSRTVGAFSQRGGRLPRPWFVFQDEDGVPVDAYSDWNPHVQDRSLTAGAMSARRATPEAQAHRISELRRDLNPEARRALDASLGNRSSAGGSL